MREYAIRIVTEGNALALALNCRYLSDFSAVRAAQSLRHDGQSAEVWRDEQCIYQEESGRKSNLFSDRPAA